MLGSAVNDTIREQMAALKREYNRSHVTISSTGSANAYVLTYTTAPPAYVHGMRFTFKANFANTATATVNVNSLGAKTIVRIDGATTLAANDIVANQHVHLEYDSGLDKMVMLTIPGTTPLSGSNHAVVVHTGNGHGSTNTMIRRFTTAMTNVGTAITYADSATLGATFTINETGFYAISYKDRNAAMNSYCGISVNSTQLTTSIISIAVADRLAFGRAAGNASPQVSIVEMLTAGDVIRAHTDSTPDLTTNEVKFSIRKIGS